MGNNKMKTKVLLIFAIILLLVILILTIFCNTDCNSVRGRKDTRNMISGSDDSHWYHIKATVKEVNTAKKTLAASVPKNDFFDSEEVQVDCSKKSVDMEGIKEGDCITIYFFRSSISGNAVKAEDIT